MIKANTVPKITLPHLMSDHLNDMASFLLPLMGNALLWFI
jgi:hypothetical protein